MKVTVLLAACGVLLGGCVNADTTYTGPEGQEVMCSGVGWGVFGAIASEVAYQKCKTFYASRGWKEAP